MEKVFRDPVHSLMRFDEGRDRLVLSLIDTREVQRLRHIRQMGISDLIFPGATHTRFAHSLGVCFLMKRVIERMDLRRKQEAHTEIARSLESHRDLLLAAALLHDVGHFPLSHLLEEVLGVNHERRGVALIRNADSEIHQVLKAFDPDMPEQVARVLDKSYKPAYVVKLISSQLDVDRMDYLLRDSLYTGVGYGKYDLDWLIHSLRIVSRGNDHEVAVDLDKGLQVAESYVLARYYMYQQVYLHRIERAAGAMLMKLFQRARERLLCGALAGTPEPLARLLCEDGEVDHETFLSLTDHTLNQALAGWVNSIDPVLSGLSERLARRQVFKTLSLSRQSYEANRGALHALCRAHGLDPEYYLWWDNASDSPYCDAFWMAHADQPEERVYLVDGAGRLSELGEHSSLLRGIRNRPFHIERLCFPEEIREPIAALLGGAAR